MLYALLEHALRRVGRDLVLAHAQQPAADGVRVLAQERRRRERARIHALDAERLREDGVLADLGVDEAAEEAPVRQLRVGEGAPPPPPGARGAPARLQPLGQREGVLLPRPAREERIK